MKQTKSFQKIRRRRRRHRHRRPFLERYKSMVRPQTYLTINLPNLTAITAITAIIIIVNNDTVV